MAAKASIRSTMLDEASQTTPKIGLGREGSQLELELRAFEYHREAFYSAVRHGVEEGWEKQTAFADDVGMSNRDVSLRLRHADCSKGYMQPVTGEMVARLGMRPAARLAFMRELGAAWGLTVEPAVTLTVEDKARILAAGMTDGMKRSLEREHGLPKGALDR